MAAVTPQTVFAGVDPSRSAEERVGHSPIRRVGILGAGTMGARIAAHVANAGFPVLLLDMPAQEAPGEEGKQPAGSSRSPGRNGLAAKALEEIRKAKPPALASPELASLISIGNFEDDLARLKDCDWVIEAVAEKMEIKRALLAKVAPYVGSAAILSTNTSGLPVEEIAASLPPAIRRRWLGTHFFNPPRYMRLLELIPTAETAPQVMAAIVNFAGTHLGKTMVVAKDTPNFIANRIGTFALLNTWRVMRQMGLSVEEVDALTGSPLGWPKTGTFRLADMVGIDVLASVAHNFAVNAKDERSDVEAPAVLDEMLSRKWLGDKSGQGFYKKLTGKGAEVSKEGRPERLVLDLQTLEYRSERRAGFPGLELAKNIETVADRIRALLAGDLRKDKAAAFYWQVLPELWSYAANRLGEISDSVADIDRAMRTGFNWELGPFEMWDAAGVDHTVAVMRERGQALPSALEKLQAAGFPSWYRDEGAECFDPVSVTYKPADSMPGVLTLVQAQRVAKRSGAAKVDGNSGVSLIDLGDGIGCFEFHSKMNTLGRDIVTFLVRTLSPGSEAVDNFQGFVITNEAQNFSAGANLMQLLLAAQDEDWDEIEVSIRNFQKMTQAIKFCPRPVVAAPFGLTLGGGSEICLHAPFCQAHLELYMGLVETSVGVVPAGGGLKEMALRAIEAASEVRPDHRGDSVEVLDSFRRAFEIIAMARVSSSALEARSLRLLRDRDSITMGRDRLLHDAKLAALRLAQQGYAPLLPRDNIPAPGETVLATLQMGVHLMREGEYISDHDAIIGRHVARVLCGGGVPPGTLLTEQYLLDLEREAFVSLCGERKTQERIAFTLKTGKPLRN